MKRWLILNIFIMFSIVFGSCHILQARISNDRKIAGKKWQHSAIRSEKATVRVCPVLDNIQLLGTHRNIILIQDHYNQSGGRLTACTIALLRALQAEVAPILVSSCVWSNMCTYLAHHGNEHFLKPKKQHWNIYAVTKHLYLAVPKVYEECLFNLAKNFELVQPIFDSITSKLLTRHDIILGLKISALQKLKNPFDCSSAYTMQHMIGSLFGGTKADITVEVLHRVMLTEDDIANIQQYPHWEPFLLGHGKERKKSKNAMFAGFSIDGFRSFLKFLNEDIHTNLLIYQTCYGGGNYLKQLYMTADKPDRYNFTIISCCTTNAASSIIYNPFSENNLDFAKLFRAVDDRSVNHSLEQRLSAYIPRRKDSVRKRIVENIPSIRRAGETEFTILGADKCEMPIQVYYTEGREKSDYKKEPFIVDNKHVLFVYDNAIDVPVIMKGTCCAIIPMNEGTGAFVIEKLEAEDHLLDDIVLYSPSSISMPSVPTGTCLIKELVCKKEACNEKCITLKNVTITTRRISNGGKARNELCVNSSSRSNRAVRKRVVYEHEGHVYSYEMSPKKPGLFEQMGSMLHSVSSVASFVKTGFGVCSGNPLSIASLPNKVMSLSPTEQSSCRKIKNKKMWCISKPKRMSPKKANYYRDQFINKLEKSV